MAYPEDRNGDTARMGIADGTEVEKRDVVTVVGDSTIAPVEAGDDPLGVVTKRPAAAPGVAGEATTLALGGRRNAKVTDDAEAGDRLIGAGDGRLGPVPEGVDSTAAGVLCLRPAKDDGLGLILLR